VDKVKSQFPDEREVQKAKNQIEADYIMSQDSIFYQAMVYAQFELIGDWRLKEKYLDGIRKVTPEDVQRVAKKYIVQNKRTVGTLIPIKNSKKDKLQKPGVHSSGMH
jgi:zinc protease